MNIKGQYDEQEYSYSLNSLI